MYIHMFYQSQITQISSGISSVYPVPASEERVHQHNHQEDEDGGLVPAVHAGPEH